MKCDDMNDDDHYIPNTNNAHLDLQGFEEELRSMEAENRQLGVSDDDIAENFYHHALGYLNNPPDEPGNDDLICRFLTPKKFLWFVGSKYLRFCATQEFDDPRECSLPEDYDNSVRKILYECSLPASEWDNQVWRKSQQWLVSCWTIFNSYHDDNLIWHKYANGPEGVGITIRYGQLRDCLQKNIEQVDAEGSLKAGRVSYDFPIRLLPFNKRKMFRNEKEVRFACRNFQHTRDFRVDVSGVFKEFGLRFSPDAPEHHVEAAQRIWKECGGTERYQTPEG